MTHPPDPQPPPPPQLKTDNNLLLRAWELKRAGFNHRQIAQGLKITPRIARRLIAQAAEEFADLPPFALDHQTILELARLDSVLTALAAKVKEGDLHAIDRWLKTSESRRKLLGLNRPPSKTPLQPPAPPKLYDSINLNNV